jgi:hypothetical protein
MNFKDYYEKEQQTYEFRIKFAGKIGDEEMDVVEKVLSKYRPSKITTPKKMIFQTNPLGFTGVKNVEVWFVDATLTVPAHTPTLSADIKSEFGISYSSPLITITGANDDPIADQEEILQKEHDALLLDPANSEHEEVKADELFGDAYNGKFLAYLQKAEEDREHKKKVDAPHPITKWEKQPIGKDVEPKIDSRNFNDLRDDDQPTFSARVRKENK